MTTTVRESILLEAMELALHYTNKDHPFRKERVAGVQLPYFTHCLEVMKTAWRWGVGDEILLAALVCHDLVEDTSCPLTDISRLDLRAGSIVNELTYDETQGTKEEYMHSFAHKSIEAVVGKLCDRLVNVKDFVLTNPKYAPKYFEKARPLFDIAGQRKQEIIERFGQEVWDNYVRDYTEISCTLCG